MNVDYRRTSLIYVRNQWLGFVHTSGSYRFAIDDHGSIGPGVYSICQVDNHPVRPPGQHKSKSQLK